jgi:hypothetical protein
MVADLIRGHRTALRSRWRKATPGTQALLVLAVLRHDQRLDHLAGGNGISASTLRRWVLETVALLAAKAQRLGRVLRRMRAAGHTVSDLLPTRLAPGVSRRGVRPAVTAFVRSVRAAAARRALDANGRDAAGPDAAWQAVPGVVAITLGSTAQRSDRTRSGMHSKDMKITI